MSPISTQEYHSCNSLTHLEVLEAEAIHIIREAAAEAENPIMLYSIGTISPFLYFKDRGGQPELRFP